MVPSDVGNSDGTNVGILDGEVVGYTEGANVGFVGWTVGELVGKVGIVDGGEVGSRVGASVPEILRYRWNIHMYYRYIGIVNIIYNSTFIEICDRRRH